MHHIYQIQVYYVCIYVTCVYACVCARVCVHVCTCVCTRACVCVCVGGHFLASVIVSALATMYSSESVSHHAGSVPATVLRGTDLSRPAHRLSRGLATPAPRALGGAASAWLLLCPCCRFPQRACSPVIEMDPLHLATEEKPARL